MAKVKQRKSYCQLQGYSIIEVIVSTIIILIAFMAFSFLLGQLMTSRKIVPETKFLFRINPGRANELTDSATVKAIDQQGQTNTTTEVINTIPFEHTRITDKATGRQIIHFYSRPNTVFLFQE